MADWGMGSNDIDPGSGGDNIETGFQKADTLFADIYTNLNRLRKLRAGESITDQNANDVIHDTTDNKLKYWDTSGTPQWSEFASSASTDWGSGLAHDTGLNPHMRNVLLECTSTSDGNVRLLAGTRSRPALCFVNGSMRRRTTDTTVSISGLSGMVYIHAQVDGGDATSFTLYASANATETNMTRVGWCNVVSNVVRHGLVSSVENEVRQDLTVIGTSANVGSDTLTATLMRSMEGSTPLFNITKDIAVGPDSSLIVQVFNTPIILAAAGAADVYFGVDVDGDSIGSAVASHDWSLQRTLRQYGFFWGLSYGAHRVLPGAGITSITPCVGSTTNNIKIYNDPSTVQGVTLHQTATNDYHHGVAVVPSMRIIEVRQSGAFGVPGDSGFASD